MLFNPMVLGEDHAQIIHEKHLNILILDRFQKGNHWPNLYLRPCVFMQGHVQIIHKNT